MQQSPHAFLIVEKGEPYGAGDVVPLVGDKTLLGRSSQEYEPDLAFDSPYVSRQHSTIEYSEGAHTLTDLDSRHGTFLNGSRLTPGEAYDLEDRVRIILARDEVVLTFSVAHPTGSETWDYAESRSETLSTQKPGPVVVLDRERREVIIDGRMLDLTGKLYDLLCLFYENRGRVVSHVEIKRVVWQERELGADGMPLVTNEEVATLIYRLRRRLGPHAYLVRTVPGYGYMLDIK
jgi:hypothetical protein